MNYSIIKDPTLLEEFIEWLPELTPDTCYYFCLFARSKYAKNDDGTNKFPHIKTDKSQLARWTVHNKKDIITKIKQKEVAVGAYKTKDGDDIPQEALALYMTPNPRSQSKAMLAAMKRFCDIIGSKGQGFNIHQEALSAIQKSPAKKIFFDLDFDMKNPSIDLFRISQSTIEQYINKDACNYLITRGGFHLLVELAKIEQEYSKSWYKNICSLGPDIKGDNMIPVPGTYQGGFIPHFLK